VERVAGAALVRPKKCADAVLKFPRKERGDLTRMAATGQAKTEKKKTERRLPKKSAACAAMGARADQTFGGKGG